MKKFLSILLILIYSTASFGMSVKEYYCCGKLSSVSVSFNTAGKIQKDATKNGGCCKTKWHVSKVNEKHIASDALALSAKHFTAVDFVVPYSIDICGFINTHPVKANAIHGPPLVYDATPIYIYNCVFRI
jgi:hypothetical protein